jgi:hypothetical protein
MKRSQDKPQVQVSKRILTREEILAKHKAQIRLIDIPGWEGAVRVRPPAFPEIVRLKMQHADEAEFKIALAIASCVDLKSEDFQAIREGDGFAFSTMVNAVMAAASEGINVGN